MKRKLVLMMSALMTISLLAGCGTSDHTHEWGEVTYTWASDYSTCTALRVCKGDENHKEEETAKSVYSVTTSATCEADGEGKYTVTFKNTAFETQVKKETIEAKGHVWGTPTYTWSDDYSSCTATRVCENDPNHKESETAYSAYTVTIPATCDTDGSAVYDVAFENEAFKAQSHEITLPATEHSWGTPTYTWSDDYSSCTATRVCENDPDHIESETVDSTSVETEASYFVEGSITYTATFTSAAFSTQTYQQKTSDKIPYYGEVPLLSEDGKTLTYGLYPQTNVNDEELLTALDELTTPGTNGYYFHENAYYAKVSATPQEYIDCAFDNGTPIESGTTYWFKCEPITWNVLSNTDGEYYILSSVLLDANCYYHNTPIRSIGGEDIYPNNYEHSDIRSWLNDEFYNSAFALDNSYIQKTTVDNSASTTDPSDDNPYVCGDTQDNVFLPSYKDYINPGYGFLASENATNTRYCKTTDWARARGAYCDTSSSYLYNGFYWTRSPGKDDADDTGDVRVWYVDIDGSLYGDLRSGDCYYKNFGVRPAISIQIAQLKNTNNLITTPRDRSGFLYKLSLIKKAADSNS